MNHTMMICDTTGKVDPDKEYVVLVNRIYRNVYSGLPFHSANPNEILALRARAADLPTPAARLAYVISTMRANDEKEASIRLNENIAWHATVERAVDAAMSAFEGTRYNEAENRRRRELLYEFIDKMR